jgi:hypothetical protein
MQRLALAAIIAGSMALGLASRTDAAPITCPSPQVATKVVGGWECVNHGGNTSGAAETKNPND